VKETVAYTQYMKNLEKEAKLFKTIKYITEFLTDENPYDDDENPKVSCDVNNSTVLIMSPDLIISIFKR